jgi:hypothetical protein
MKERQYNGKSLVGWLMVFNATFNNISVILSIWRSALLVEETEVPGENH